MSYVKHFKEFTIRAEVAEGKVWMCIEHSKDLMSDSASGFVKAPNIIERLFGITWQDKLEMKEKKLFKEMLKKQKLSCDPVIQAEIDKFLKGK